MTDDQLLKEQKSVSSEGLEYSFVGLASSTIETVDACINLVWIMANYNKTKKPRDIIINAKELFKSEEIKLKDTFWKEHCAESLRELADSHFEQNCKRFLKCVSERSNSDEERKICESLRLLKDFLNDFGHFKNTAIDHAKKILEDNTLVEINEKNFDKICTSFVSQLESFFKYKKL